jgi:hypothetical protein
MLVIPARQCEQRILYTMGAGPPYLPTWHHDHPVVVGVHEPKEDKADEATDVSGVEHLQEGRPSRSTKGQQVRAYESKPVSHRHTCQQSGAHQCAGTLPSIFGEATQQQVTWGVTCQTAASQ